MAESNKNVIRTIFELIVLLLALGVISGGLAAIVFFSPWSKMILASCWLTISGSS